MNAFRFRQAQAEPDLDLLPPERPARPMPQRLFQPVGDVIDAEYVTVVDMPRRSFDTRRFNDNRADARPVRRRSGPIGSMLHDMAVRAERTLTRLSDAGFAVLVACAFFGVFLLAGGLSASLFSSQAQDPANSLDITHVSLTPQDANGMRVLLINAIVENRDHGRHSVPPVRADLVSNGQMIASTLIAAPVEVIDGGHSYGISARLQHPGGKMPELRLSFAHPDVTGS